MSAPNLRVPSSITGRTTLYSVTTSLTEVLANGAASGKLLRVNTIRATSKTTTSSAFVNLTIYRNSTHTYLVKEAAVPAGKALVVSDKNEYIYLEEGDAIYASAYPADSLDLTISYEDIA